MKKINLKKDHLQIYKREINKCIIQKHKRNQTRTKWIKEAKECLRSLGFKEEWSECENHNTCQNKKPCLDQSR